MEGESSFIPEREREGTLVEKEDHFEVEKLNQLCNSVQHHIRAFLLDPEVDQRHKDILTGGIDIEKVINYSMFPVGVQKKQTILSPYKKV
ncbi:MAG: hypothetical protein AB1352_02885 [Patescibacteria group bacterium]